VNEQFDAEFYAVPKEAVEDPEAADAVLGGDETVIDVQTHYVADRDQQTAIHLPALYRNTMPSWWRGLDGHDSYSFAEYLRCVFLETENAVAVWAPRRASVCAAHNGELKRAASRGLGQRNRLLMLRRRPDEAEVARVDGRMDGGVRRSWKVYTMGEPNLTLRLAWCPGLARHDARRHKVDADDDDIGQQFVERVEELAPRCPAHHLRPQRISS
jgi:hypothetical protein